MSPRAKHRQDMWWALRSRSTKEHSQRASACCQSRRSHKGTSSRNVNRMYCCTQHLHSHLQVDVSNLKASYAAIATSASMKLDDVCAQAQAIAGLSVATPLQQTRYHVTGTERVHALHAAATNWQPDHAVQDISGGCWRFMISLHKRSFM
jgi:hypothetical protein